MRKNKKKNKIGRVFIFISIVIFLSLFFFSIYSKNNVEKKEENIISDNSESNKETEVIENSVEKEEDKVHEYEVSMVMVGDALIHESIFLSHKTESGYDFNPMLERIKPIVEKYDLAYYNQETILGGSELGVSTYPRFNSPYEVGDAFINAGFNIVSLANNHSADRGKTAIVNSVNYWNSKEGVLTAGSYLSEEERVKDRIFTKNNISYTMLSYTMDTNGLPIPNGESYLIDVYEPNKVKEDIERVRSKVDVLMVAMHWGTEYSNYVNDSQRQIAEYLSSLGVDIIIGAHPHVIQPVAYVGNTLVIYSLGNAISSQEGPNKRSGLMMSVNIHKKVDKDGTTITLEHPTARPIYTYYIEGSPRHHFMIYPYDELNDSILNNYAGLYEEIMEIVTSESNKIEKYPLFN